MNLEDFELVLNMLRDLTDYFQEDYKLINPGKDLYGLTADEFYTLFGREEQLKITLFVKGNAWPLEWAIPTKYIKDIYILENYIKVFNYDIKAYGRDKR